ncbi:MAG: lysophospholipid acyltransferase family protein [Actinomycetota bacterium]|nr:lysophospholipid acyltransferase family protein [Actinomycetota bacterium]
MAYWALKIVLTPILRLLYRVRVEGSGHVPRSGPVILASNHQSFIDSVFLALCVGRRVTFVAKAEYFESWKTAWFFRAVGMIPLKREGGSASERALAAAREVLMAGGVLGIYPEGTRSPDGRLYKGHTGVARLAIQCGAPVVPVAQFGTAGVQPIGALLPKLFKRVHLEMGAPLRIGPDAGGPDPGRAGAEAGSSGTGGGPRAMPGPRELRRITDEIMRAIADLSGQEYVGAYAKRDRGLLSAPGSDAEPTVVRELVTPRARAVP